MVKPDATGISSASVTGPVNVMEVYALFLLGGWKKDQINLDIVPLFETVDDLHHAAGS